MADENKQEGRHGVDRVEAFSDGVLAIIITIMVLELHAPDKTGLAALLPLWTTFFAYVVSYNYIAIYWVNHHRLFSHALTVTNSLLWSNIVLLFALSMIPFSTAYLGKHFGDPVASALYAVSLMVPGLAFVWLQSAVRSSGSNSDASQRYHRRTRRKGYLAALAYGLAIPLGLILPYLGVSLAGLVGVFWMFPGGSLDKLFTGADRMDGE